MRLTRITALLVAFVMLVAACGGGDSDGDTATTAEPSDSNTATTAAETTTTAAPTTTEAPETTTTTAAPETTTTLAATLSETDAAMIAEGKTAAVEAIIPDDWTTSITNGFELEESTDDVFVVCTDDDTFDVNQLEAFTLAVSTLETDAPQPAGSFFPGGNASIEARVFQSAAVADEAFGILEEVFGTEEGRQCLVDEFLSEMQEDLAVGEEVDFVIEEIDVPGADVAVAISMSMTIEGISFSFTIELAAALNDACTVYSVFLGFGEPFDPEARDQLFETAISA